MPQVASPNTTDPLYEIIWSKVYSQMFKVALEFQLFKFIGTGSKTVTEISSFCTLSHASVRVMLQYLCGLRLLKYRSEKIFNTPLSIKLIEDPRMADDLIDWHTFLDDLDLKSLLRSPTKQPWYEIRQRNSRVFGTEGISDQFFISDRRHQWRVQKGVELAMRYDFKKHKMLLDVGGASGGWSAGIRKIYPHLTCSIFDLPEICSLAKEKLEDSRIGAIQGDFFRDELRSGADVVLLANILHDWNKNDGLEILRNVYRSLPARGVVLVYEYFLNDSWQGPLAALYHAITVLGPGEESGWQPSYAEMEEMLITSGFSSIEKKYNLMLGIKP